MAPPHIRCMPDTAYQELPKSPRGPPRRAQSLKMRAVAFDIGTRTLPSLHAFAAAGGTPWQCGSGCAGRRPDRRLLGGLLLLDLLVAACAAGPLAAVAIVGEALVIGELCRLCLDQRTVGERRRTGRLSGKRHGGEAKSKQRSADDRGFHDCLHGFARAITQRAASRSRRFSENAVDRTG